jgi:toxin CptA
MSCDFTLVPSRGALGFILLAAAATLLLLAALPGWPSARLAAMVWCMGIAGHAFKRHRASHAVRVEGASISVDGIEGRIVAGSFVAPWLTIVHWRPQGARFTRTLAVLPDAIDAEAFRALRVILRWSPPR